MSTYIRKFDPFKDSIKADERLRIKNGQLLVENVSIRKKANCVTRFFTRYQYSQSRIANLFHDLCTRCVVGSVSNSTNEQFQLLQNYNALMNRAKTQNLLHARFTTCDRWFKGKSEIKLHIHTYMSTLLVQLCFPPRINVLKDEYGVSTKKLAELKKNGLAKEALSQAQGVIDTLTGLKLNLQKLEEMIAEKQLADVVKETDELRKNLDATIREAEEFIVNQFNQNIKTAQTIEQQLKLNYYKPADQDKLRLDTNRLEAFYDSTRQFPFSPEKVIRDLIPTFTKLMQDIRVLLQRNPQLNVQPKKENLPKNNNQPQKASPLVQALQGLRDPQKPEKPVEAPQQGNLQFYTELKPALPKPDEILKLKEKDVTDQLKNYYELEELLRQYKEEQGFGYNAPKSYTDFMALLQKEIRTFCEPIFQRMKIGIEGATKKCENLLKDLLKINDLPAKKKWLKDNSAAIDAIKNENEQINLSNYYKHYIDRFFQVEHQEVLQNFQNNFKPFNRTIEDVQKQQDLPPVQPRAPALPPLPAIDPVRPFPFEFQNAGGFNQQLPPLPVQLVGGGAPNPLFNLNNRVPPFGVPANKPEENFARLFPPRPQEVAPPQKPGKPKVEVDDQDPVFLANLKEMEKIHQNLNKDIFNLDEVIRQKRIQFNTPYNNEQVEKNKLANHAHVLNALIQIQKKRAVLVKYLQEKQEDMAKAYKERDRVRKERNEPNYFFNPFYIQEINNYLRDTSGSSHVFHVEEQDPTPYILRAAELYTQAHRHATKAGLLKDFHTRVFPGGYACVEGNMTTLMEWIRINSPEVNADLVAAIEPTMEKLALIGEYYRAFTEIQFRSWFRICQGIEYDNTIFNHRQFYLTFTKEAAPEREALPNDLTPVKMIKMPLEGLKAFLEKDAFSAFMKDVDKIYPMKYTQYSEEVDPKTRKKIGTLKELTKAELPQLIDEHWAINMIDDEEETEVEIEARKKLGRENEERMRQLQERQANRAARAEADEQDGHFGLGDK